MVWVRISHIPTIQTLSGPENASMLLGVCVHVSSELNLAKKVRAGTKKTVGNNKVPILSEHPQSRLTHSNYWSGVARGCCTNFMAIKYGKKKLHTTFSPFTGVNSSQRRVWALKPHVATHSLLLWSTIAHIIVWKLPVSSHMLVICYANTTRIELELFICSSRILIFLRSQKNYNNPDHVSFDVDNPPSKKLSPWWSVLPFSVCHLEIVNVLVSDILFYMYLRTRTVAVIVTWQLHEFWGKRKCLKITS